MCRGFALRSLNPSGLRTIFNRVTEYKPIVVEHVEMVEHESELTIEITMRACGNCNARYGKRLSLKSPKFCKRLANCALPRQNSNAHDSIAIDVPNTIRPVPVLPAPNGHEFFA